MSITANYPDCPNMQREYGPDAPLYDALDAIRRTGGQILPAARILRQARVASVLYSFIGLRDGWRTSAPQHRDKPEYMHAYDVANPFRS